MKNLIFALLLLATVAFAQKSEYNKNLTLTKETKEDFWFSSENKVTKEQSEVFTTEQNTVGYFKSFKEIHKILEFYALDFNKPNIDNSLLEPNTAIDNYKEMSFDLFLKNATISKIWISEKVGIQWRCDYNFNWLIIYPKY